MRDILKVFDLYVFDLVFCHVFVLAACVQVVVGFGLSFLCFINISADLCHINVSCPLPQHKKQ